MEELVKYQFLELILRVFCGLIFLFQGFDKLFVVKPAGVVELFRNNARQKHIPPSLLYIVALLTSSVEFFGGLLLILGLLKSYVLIMLGFDVILVALAFSLMEPVWDMRHVFPRLVMVVLLLVMPDEWARFSLDNLMIK